MASAPDSPVGTNGWREWSKYVLRVIEANGEAARELSKAVAKQSERIAVLEQRATQAEDGRKEIVKLLADLSEGQSEISQAVRTLEARVGDLSQLTQANASEGKDIHERMTDVEKEMSSLSATTGALTRKEKIFLGGASAAGGGTIVALVELLRLIIGGH